MTDRPSFYEYDSYRNPKPQPTVVYQLFNSHGALIYVGITRSGVNRFNQHLHLKPWFAEVASCTFEHFDTRAAAAQREQELIRAERPVYNIQYLSGRRKRSPQSRGPKEIAPESEWIISA